MRLIGTRRVLNPFFWARYLERNLGIVGFDTRLGVFQVVDAGSSRPARLPDGETIELIATGLQGAYAGQPSRKTARPSAELLLGVMKTISVSVIQLDGRIHALLSPLTDLQKRLLLLWNLPPELYDNVARGFLEPPWSRSEP